MNIRMTSLMDLVTNTILTNSYILNMEVERISKDIIELQKEAEQFSYILEEEKKELMKKILLAEEEASTEYIQSKYISRNKGLN